MTIDGFTYVRNGIKMGYPFIASINSILPLVDRIFVVVGDSDDGTREAVTNIDNDKIIIIDSVWDDEKRKNGTVFKEQSNIGLEQVDADWAFHIQADEVFLESDIENIRKYLDIANSRNDVDGLLFPFYHFWGDYAHIWNTRRSHPFEIRAFKNNGKIQSFRDSQGFRIFESEDDEIGKKLRVINTGVRVFHYSYTRHPKLMRVKQNYFIRFWRSDAWLKKHNNNNNNVEFDYNNIDHLEEYTGEHPNSMTEIIKNKDWNFVYDSSKSNMSLKEKILNFIRRKTGIYLFENKNYILVK